MGARNVRPVAETIQSHPVPGCTACPGILAAPCKHGGELDFKSGLDWRRHENRGETGVGGGEGWVKGRSSRDCISAGDAASEAKMRKFYCEVCRSLAHTCAASSGGNFDCYRNETAPRGTTEVIGPRPSFRSAERTARRRYGNSLMREDGDKIELMGKGGSGRTGCRSLQRTRDTLISRRMFFRCRRRRLSNIFEEAIGGR